MAIFIDITEWNEIRYFNTKGTRNKCVVRNPLNDELYFFKTSIQKDQKDYKTEFWSEIIASEIGNALGFNVLKYDIALHGNEIGCISKSMIGNEETLVEGISLLTGYDNTYTPESKDSYSEYTFQFIKKALNNFDLDSFVDDVIKVIIFDSIIGNSDRHQENWAFIAKHMELKDEEVDNIITKLKEKFQSIKDFLKQNNIETKDASSKIKIEVKYIGRDSVFAPIYDSGCCLAREKTEEAIKQMLNDSVMFNSFINRGKAEIRWEGIKGKINHFDLIKNIRNEFPKIVDETIKNVVSLYDKKMIEDIVFNIDNALPSDLKQIHGISESRKKLICNLIYERVKRLNNIIL